MGSAIVFVGCGQMSACHDIEQKTWLNDGTDVAALAEEVAVYLVHRVSGRSDLEATIRVSDEG